MPFPNKQTQFKKGQSGNKSGRPKGAKNITTVLFDLITETYPFSDVPQSFVKTYLKDRKSLRRSDAYKCVTAYLFPEE